MHLGKSPRFVLPRTFNEYIQRRKITDHDPRLPLRIDKVLVKDFVESKLGPGWTTPTLWHGPMLPPLSERRWPVPFVLKANHGCDMNIFIRRPTDLDWPRIEPLCEKWLREDYSAWAGEWAYRNIEPQLLVEPFIGASQQSPEDYRLWTFDGRVEFIQIDTGRQREHKRATFDRHWQRLPFTTQYPDDKTEIEHPRSLERMIEAAEILSEKMSFVRVDLYEIDGTPRFGELTFYPSAGQADFDPPEFDRKVGQLWPRTSLVRMLGRLTTR